MNCSVDYNRKAPRPRIFPPMRLLFLLLLPLVFFASVAVADPPQTVWWDGVWLEEVQSSANDKNFSHVAALQSLQHEAEKALRRGPYSVMDKKLVPPSGDKHDYMSFGPYWWPNPDTPDGLPYVRHDGKVNPASSKGSDNAAFGGLCNDVQTLSLAGYFFDDARYSRHAVELLRTWFLAPATRMNPHLEYGQAVPGKVTGRGIGIIDTCGLIDLLDAVEVLRTTGELTASDLDGLQAWFREYLHWLRTSKHGIEERRAKNNHGTWYDAQCARFAIFVGDLALTEEIVAAARRLRIERQIEPDGSQPDELVRTKSFSYSVFNLAGLCSLARAGEVVEVDLWNYRSADGRSIRAALDYLMPYLEGQDKWPYEQIGGTNLSSTGAAMLRVAANKYGAEEYQSIEPKLRRKGDREILRLLWR